MAYSLKSVLLEPWAGSPFPVVRDGIGRAPYIRCSASRNLRGRTGTKGRCCVWVELHERRVVLGPGESTGTISNILAHFKVQTLNVEVIRSCMGGSAAVVSAYSSRANSYCILAVSHARPQAVDLFFKLRGPRTSFPSLARWRRDRPDGSASET